MSYIRCSNPLIAYQLEDGVFHCTEEMVHSKAVLVRWRRSEPTMYIMRIKPFADQVHCAGNFKDQTLAGLSELKIAGDFEAIRKDMPSFVAKYKLRRLLFDDQDLYHRFLDPTLERLMCLVDYVPDPESALNGLPERFERSQPRTTNRPVARRPAMSPNSARRPSPSSSYASVSSGSSAGWYTVGIVVVIVFLLWLKGC